MARNTASRSRGSKLPADPAGRLLEYNPEARPWHEIRDDGYLYDHLADLLLAAGREDDLLALFDGDGWMNARYMQQNCTYTGFLNDLTAAWKNVLEPRAAEDPDALARCARFALIRAAVTTLCVGEVRIQARYGEQESASRRAYAGAPEFASALMPRPVVEPKEAAFNHAYLTAAASELASQERPQALAAVLDTAVAVENASGRAHALSLLGPHLRRSQAPLALRTALDIDNAYYRARAVERLLPHLTDTALEDARSAGPAVSSLTRRGLTLSAIWQIATAPVLRFIAPALEPPRRLLGWLPIFSLARLKDKYRAAARACLIPGQRGQSARAAHVNVNDLRLLQALIPHLSHEVLANTLEKVIAHRCEDGKARAIPWFAPYGGEALKQRELEGALSLEYEGDRARALRGLAPYLSGDLRERALAKARAAADPRIRAEVLAAFLPGPAAQTPALIRDIRRAISGWLIGETRRTFDEMVVLCLDDTLFRTPIVGRRALRQLHRSIREISREWHWQ